MFKILCIAATIYFTVQPIVIAATNDSEALLNERFPVDNKLLQKQWGVDCDQAVRATHNWLSLQVDQNEKSWDTLDWKDLYRCGLLFNTQGTGRYQMCPDYLTAYQVLLATQKGEQLFDPSVIANLLSNRCRVQNKIDEKAKKIVN